MGAGAADRTQPAVPPPDAPACLPAQASLPRGPWPRGRSLPALCVCVCTSVHKVPGCLLVPLLCSIPFHFTSTLFFICFKCDMISTYLLKVFLREYFPWCYGNVVVNASSMNENVNVFHDPKNKPWDICSRFAFPACALRAALPAVGRALPLLRCAPQIGRAHV